MNAVLRALFVVCLGCGIATDVAAQTQRIDLTSSNVQRITTLEGNHYVIEFDIPEGIVSVRHAWMEVRMDVSAREPEPVADPAPMLEVYMLKNALTGDPVPADFESTRLPMSRPVALGPNRLVKLDITEFVQRILADPRTNHGIVVGSLTGARTGEFVVKPDGFGPGTPIRLTIIE